MLETEEGVPKGEQIENTTVLIIDEKREENLPRVFNCVNLSNKYAGGGGGGRIECGGDRCGGWCCLYVPS